jgi:hypothetical protein
MVFSVQVVFHMRQRQRHVHAAQGKRETEVPTRFN